MAGASKSKRSRSNQESMERYGKRRIAFVAPLPVIIVVCDDAKTAVSYFGEIKNLVRRRATVRVFRNPHDRATAREVVDYAIEQRALLSEKGASDVADKTHAWALIDTEWDSERQAKAHNAQKYGRAKGIGVALSNPCFEVWTLLHLIDTGEYFSGGAAVLARLEDEWIKFFGDVLGPKAQADYSKLMPLLDTAKARARQRNESKPRSQSWTEIYQVIAVIPGI
jgi:hypothetical protein